MNDKLTPLAAVRDAAQVENWDEFPNGRYGDARSPGNRWGWQYYSLYMLNSRQIAFGETTYAANQILPVIAWFLVYIGTVCFIHRVRFRHPKQQLNGVILQAPRTLPSYLLTISMEK